MSLLMMKMLQPYRDGTNGDGGDAGGGAPADRGDSLEANAAGTAANAAAEAAAAADAQAAEDLKKLEGDGKGAGEDDGQARDAGGKFTKKDKGDGDHIPKARFDDAVGKERAAREAAEARAAAAEARLQQEAKSADVAKMEEAIEDLEKQHAKLLLDGEHEKAAAVMKQIRHGERKIATLESDSKVAAATSQAVEQVRMDAAISSLEAAHPQFNPDSEEFDQDLVDIVLAEQARLIREQGQAPSAALTNAANKIMKKFAPADTGKGDAKGLAAAKGAEDRKAAQVAKNLDTAKKQPASLSEAGVNSDKAGAKTDKEASQMTAEEFAALPEATKAKLRGDYM